MQKNSAFNYEFIFIYSLPEDKSVSKLKEKISNNKLIKFFPDNGTGIYSAMNMGIKKATGSYMIFFGAGKFLALNPFRICDQNS